MTRLRTTKKGSMLEGSPEGTIMAPTGALLSLIMAGVFLSRRCSVSFAVRPNRALTCSGSFTPGSWIRMRSAPWRWMVGSRVPVSSMRRRTISMDCDMVAVSISRRVCGV